MNVEQEISELRFWRRLHWVLILFLLIVSCNQDARLQELEPPAKSSPKKPAGGQLQPNQLLPNHPHVPAINAGSGDRLVESRERRVEG